MKGRVWHRGRLPGARQIHRRAAGQQRISMEAGAYRMAGYLETGGCRMAGYLEIGGCRMAGYLEAGACGTETRG
ncbi:hypothetical protein D7X48_15190 [bacterium D16-50]|nr:hypothetical protein D7X48_15190 [bacterium D16-50]